VSGKLLDMSLNARDPDKCRVTDGRIVGPIAEYDRYDRLTGATYYRCNDCGAEALARSHLAGCCE